MNSGKLLACNDEDNPERRFTLPYIAHNGGYYMSKRTKNYSIEEDAFIRDNYRSLFDDEIAEILGRSIESVIRRRQRLGCWYLHQEISEPLSGEVWKQIKDLPDGYMVSNKGRIKSGKKLCKLYLRDTGYIQWRLFNESKNISKTYKVHRLVAEYFCATNKDINLCHVHHKDKNTQNNSYENLEWVYPEDHIELHK